MFDTIFSENLTSKLIQKTSCELINKFNTPIDICEIGCGNGNISNFLIKNQKNKNNYFLSDISEKSVNAAKKNINYSKIKFKTGQFLYPWHGYKFDLIICDISAINDDVARKSNWYNGVICDAGLDGLKNVSIVLKNIKNYLNISGYFILPLISLSDHKKLKENLKFYFESIIEVNKTDWPLPNFFQDNIHQFESLKKLGLIDFNQSFGINIAFTSVIVCSKIK